MCLLAVVVDVNQVGESRNVPAKGFYVGSCDVWSLKIDGIKAADHEIVRIGHFRGGTVEAVHLYMQLKCE